MKRDVSLKKIYQQNPDTGAFLIEVALDRYEEIFNEWDPAPYKRRDLNPALLQYLEDSSEDIPLHKDVAFLFKAPAQIFSDAKECSAREGLTNWLAAAVDAERGKLHHLHSLSLINLIVAVVLLTATAYVSRIQDNRLLTAVVRDGLTIGSWVFAWEVISLFFFRRFELRRDLKKWMRLAGAQVSFAYRE
ncbi:MAG: hypothetical protein WC047_05795 [Kiritimatiellales bacterium]